MLQNKRPIIIGITGSIGSGKTTVCRLVEQKYPVYYADEIAHQVLSEPSIIEAIIERWGSSVIVNNSVDRKELAQKVFHNKSDLEFLNSLIHPGVLAKMQEIVNDSVSTYLFFEVPLLFEAKLQECFDYIVLIRTKNDIMINRVVLRDKQKPADIAARADAQLSIEKKALLSDHIIDNDGSCEELCIKAESFLKQLCGIHYRKKNTFS